MAKTLDTEAEFLKGVGPRFAPALAKAGLNTVRDVLYRVPRRYEDRTNLPPIKDIHHGQYVTIRGKVTHFETRRLRGGKVLVRATVSDRTGSVALIWFNQPWIGRQIEKYQGELIAYGMAKAATYGHEISSPEFELLDDDADNDGFARIVPVYPLTEGLPQKTIRKAAACAAEEYAELVDDPLPEGLRRRYKLPELPWALREIHLPTSDDNRKKARERLVFDEFLGLQLALAMRRAESGVELGISFPVSALLNAQVSVQDDEGKDLFGQIAAEARQSEPLWDQIHRMLPFDLTGAQRRVIQEIWADMERPHPMNRLVQGDVGSGKTAVAACALLAAVRSGYQGALMAPTEILAEQHHVNLQRLFEPLGLEVALLVGKLTAKQKQAAAQRVREGAAHLAVGTHALIQEGVEFEKLGLVIIDEQHRFGVLQRAALREKGFGNPDVLVMTATPIPRTLTMTLYGDLDLSVIDELPPGRKPVKTHWRLPADHDAVCDGVRKLLQDDRQAYFVCPLVGESEKLLAQAAEDLHYRLSNGALKDFRVGLLHGQMKSLEKEAVMDKFRRHEVDVLVSTTVIEVGVDVPNASVMVIEDANRFGLSQLHQLRGRVGRGAHQSFCILVANASTDDARARMEVMVDTNDGFRIAEEDLQLRGPGEMMGTKQHGNLGLEIGDLIQDGKSLEVARQAAMELVEEDRDLSAPKHRKLLAKVREKYGETALIPIS